MHAALGGRVAVSRPFADGPAWQKSRWCQSYNNHNHRLAEEVVQERAAAVSQRSRRVLGVRGRTGSRGPGSSNESRRMPQVGKVKSGSSVLQALKGLALLAVVVTLGGCASGRGRPRAQPRSAQQDVRRRRRSAERRASSRTPPRNSRTSTASTRTRRRRAAPSSCPPTPTTRPASCPRPSPRPSATRRCTPAPRKRRSRITSSRSPTSSR